MSAEDILSSAPIVANKSEVFETRTNVARPGGQGINRRFNTNYGFDTIVSNTAAATTTILPSEFSLGAM